MKSSIGRYICWKERWASLYCKCMQDLNDYGIIVGKKRSDLVCSWKAGILMLLKKNATIMSVIQRQNINLGSQFEIYLVVAAGVVDL